MQLVMTEAGPLIALAVANVLPQAFEQFDFCVLQAGLDDCLYDPYAPVAAIFFKSPHSSSFTLIAD